MSTYLYYKSLDLFSLGSFFCWKCPISWSISTQQLFYENDHNGLRTWRFVVGAMTPTTMAIITPVLWSCGLGNACSVSISKVKLLLLMVLKTDLIGILGGEALYYYYGADFVTGFNMLAKLDRNANVLKGRQKSGT